MSDIAPQPESTNLTREYERSRILDRFSIVISAKDTINWPPFN